MASQDPPGDLTPTPKTEETPPPELGIHPQPPSAREPEKARWRPSNLVLRLVTTAILVPPVLWICYLGGLWYVGMVIVFSSIAFNEFYGFIAAKGGTPNRLLGTLAAAALPLIVYVGDAFLATSFMTAVLLTVMLLQLTHAQIREAMMSISATFFGVFYVGWLLAHAVSVRFIAGDLSSRYPTLEFDPTARLLLHHLLSGGRGRLRHGCLLRRAQARASQARSGHQSEQDARGRSWRSAGRRALLPPDQVRLR